MDRPRDALHIVPTPTRVRTAAAGPNRNEVVPRIANHLALVVSAIRLRSSKHRPRTAAVSREDVTLNSSGDYRPAGKPGRAQPFVVGSAAANPTVCATAWPKPAIRWCRALSLERARLLCPSVRPPTARSAPDQAQALALLVNEIVINAIKHAHPTGLPVTLTSILDGLQTGASPSRSRDDGVGLPEGFDAGHDGGVGFKVIRSLAECLDATLEIRSDCLGLRPSAFCSRCRTGSRDHRRDGRQSSVLVIAAQHFGLETISACSSSSKPSPCEATSSISPSA